MPPASTRIVMSLVAARGGVAGVDVEPVLLGHAEVEQVVEVQGRVDDVPARLRRVEREGHLQAGQAKVEVQGRRRDDRLGLEPHAVVDELGADAGRQPQAVGAALAADRRPNVHVGDRVGRIAVGVGEPAQPRELHRARPEEVEEGFLDRGDRVTQLRVVGHLEQELDPELLQDLAQPGELLADDRVGVAQDLGVQLVLGLAQESVEARDQVRRLLDQLDQVEVLRQVGRRDRPDGAGGLVEQEAEVQDGDRHRRGGRRQRLGQADRQ
ncbi:MAG: hypothetical protein WKF75_00625 [Singulisphaera sp.]